MARIKLKIKHDWQYPVYCPDCKCVMFSTRAGEFQSCECGAVYCDQTPHFGRVGGDNACQFKRVFPEPEEE